MSEKSSEQVKELWGYRIYLDPEKHTKKWILEQIETKSYTVCIQRVNQNLYLCYFKDMEYCYKKWCMYDYAVKDVCMSNYGILILDEFFCPIDNNYELEEIAERFHLGK